MTRAICYFCGEMKVGAFVQCPNCGLYPEEDDHLILSLIMTDRYLDKTKMEAIGKDIKEGHFPTLTEETRQQFLPHLEEFKRKPVAKRDIVTNKPKK